MKIGTDSNGTVRLTGDAIPEEFNGAKLAVHDLSDEQEAAYALLPADRAGTTFDGKTFTAVPAPAPSYADQRRAEYPVIGDQLDAIWKGGADADAMRASVQAVKKKYPKP